MSVDQKDKIDLIGTSPDDTVILTISDHLEWDEAGEHLLILQEKINAYLEFIEGGQIYEEYPNAKTRELTISVKFKFTPNEIGLEFLHRCKAVIADMGIEFDWGVLDPTE